MIDAIKHCLTNLANFKGRDSRATFWWYVLFLLVAQYVVGFLASIPLVASAGIAAFEGAQAGLDESQMHVEMMGTMIDSMKTTVWISAFTGVVATLLFVAAFVRRLHDSGNSGYWAIIPIATQALAIIGSITLIGEFEQLMRALSDPTQVQQIQAELMMRPTNIAGWIGYLVVLVFGLLKSQDGANAYGEQPR